MPAKPKFIMPTGIHLKRLKEQSKKSHAYVRGVEIKKSIDIKPDLKQLKNKIRDLKVYLANERYDELKFKAKRELKNTELLLLKEKVRLQGKLLMAFDKYYGFNGELERIYIDSLELYNRDLIDRQRMNTEILKIINSIESPRDKDILLRKVKKTLLLGYGMKF